MASKRTVRKAACMMGPVQKAQIRVPGPTGPPSSQPISVAALYCKAEWKPICHKVTMESMQKNWKEALK